MGEAPAERSGFDAFGSVTATPRAASRGFTQMLTISVGKLVIEATDPFAVTVLAATMRAVTVKVVSGLLPRQPSSSPRMKAADPSALSLAGAPPRASGPGKR